MMPGFLSPHGTPMQTRSVDDYSPNTLPKKNIIEMLS